MDYSNIHHVAFATELSTQLATYEIMNTEKSGDEQVYELYVHLPLKTVVIDHEGFKSYSVKHTLAFVRNIERANIYKRLYNNMLVYGFNLQKQIEDNKGCMPECQMSSIRELSVSKEYNNVFEHTLKNLNKLEIKTASTSESF